MDNPYRGLPDTAFWKRAVAGPDPLQVDPVSPPAFLIGKSDRIATAGSCFAQHIARVLKQRGFRYLETETGPAERGFGVFSARFGNLYTTRQLLQLFQRAYGLFEPHDAVWTHGERFVDPFRPQVEPNGYATREDVVNDREAHLAAVRGMFEQSDVFVFTLGLTEGWRSKIDGAVFPLAPGVAGRPGELEAYEFHNFTVAEMTADLEKFVGYLRIINQNVRLVFTVSPVPLVATYEPRHVLVSTIYSKSALRVVAEEVTRATPGASYYPSYEIITGHHTRYGFFESDLRSITNVGVDRAMDLFSKHYLQNGAVSTTHSAQTSRPALREAAAEQEAERKRRAEELYHVICDEEALDV